MTTLFLPPEVGQPRDRDRAPEAQPLLAAGKAEYIGGIPFRPVNGLSDVARCGLCGQTVDVGGEIREHIAWHEAERLEALYER